MEVTSKDWFALDGVSCESVGLYCDTPPVQIMAERRGQAYQVGQDEDQYKDDDSFADISFRPCRIATTTSAHKAFASIGTV